MPDAALDATAEALAYRLLSDFPDDRPYSRSDLARLPAPVARLLGARLDARVDRAAALPDTPWVDASAPAVREAGRAWREAARAAARVPADLWAENVERAARLALSHLIRPAETLAAYAFETDDAPIAAALTLRRIQAFASYPYLPEIAGRYVERKGLGQIDRATLERLLRRIDRRMVSAFTADDWRTLLSPLFDLVGPLGSPEGSVPTALLQSLFEAKGADDLSGAVRDAEALTPDALRQRLEAALPEHAPLVASPEPAADEGEPEPAPASHAPAEADDEAIPEAGDQEPVEHDAFAEAQDAALPTEPAPASLLFPDDRPSALDDVEEVDETSDGDAPPESEEPSADGPLAAPAPAALLSPTDAPDLPDPPVEEDDVDEPLWRRLARAHGGGDPEPAADEEPPIWKQFAAESEEAEATAPPVPTAPATPAPRASSPASLDDLEARVLGDHGERRQWFVDELFEGSEADYRETLDLLDGAQSWTEATEVIAREVFRKHRVNIYSEPAVALTDAVEARMAR